MSALTCLRKKRFESKKAAQGVLQNMRARQQDTDRLEPYECTYCHKWHLRRLPPSLITLPPEAA